MRRIVTGLGLLGLGAFAATRRAYAGIMSTPDAHPAEEFERGTVGEAQRITRPDGTVIPVVVAGDGPDVILAHGYGSSLHAWFKVQQLLVDRGHRVIAFDWRAHGSSVVGEDGVTPEVIAADFAAVLEHFDVREGVLVGHSTGGYIAIAMALQQPAAVARLRGLVLFASFAGDVLEGAPQNALQVPLIEKGIMQRIAASEIGGMLFGASIYGHGAYPAICRQFRDHFLEADHQALLPLMDRLARTSFYDRLGEITLPTVVICGENDRTTPRWHSERMGSDIPDARNVWVPDAAHALHVQAPEVLVKEIESLLGSP